MIHHHHVREHGSVPTNMVLEEELGVLPSDWQQAGREPLDLTWAFETSKPATSDTLPPTRPHLLILFK